jgi:hypothetical protein
MILILFSRKLKILFVKTKNYLYNFTKFRRSDGKEISYFGSFHFVCLQQRAKTA